MENTHPPTPMPPWAHKVDEFGKRYWYKEKPVRSRRAEHIWGVVWNIFFLWLVNKVPSWDLAFINDHYNTILPVMNINLFIQIGAHLVMAIFDVRWVRYILKIVTDAATFLVAMVIYFIYPFDFSRIGHSWIDVMIPFLLIITMIVTAVSVLIHIFKLIFYRS